MPTPVNKEFSDPLNDSNESEDESGRVKRRRVFDPRRKEDRLLAFFTEYTSKVGECPFYNPSLRSKCEKDPRVIRIEDCEGRCFIRGICCPEITSDR